MAPMKEKMKTQEKELSDKEIANLSDVEFKTLIIRMLTELWDTDKLGGTTGEQYRLCNPGCQ